MPLTSIPTPPAAAAPEFDRELQYLYEFLKDEFYRYPLLSIRLSPSVKDRGVTVRSETREYFFDVLWVVEGKFRIVQELAAEVRDHLDAHL